MASFNDRSRDTVPGEATRIAAVWTKWRRLAAAAIVGGAAMHGVDAGASDIYLRAGMDLDRPSETVFTDQDCSSASLAVLYGCGRGGDGARLRSVGDFGTIHALELGLGYTARADSTEDRPDRTLSRCGHRRCPHPDRRNPHDLSEDDDRRAGHEPYRFRLDTDGRGRGGSE